MDEANLTVRMHAHSAGVVNIAMPNVKITVIRSISALTTVTSLHISLFYFVEAKDHSPGKFLVLCRHLELHAVARCFKRCTMLHTEE